MKRNSILVLGMGVLLTFGLFAPGCGDSGDGGGTGKDSGVDGKKDGPAGTGGKIGTGGAPGTGGVIGTGGSTVVGGAPGTGGVTGAGGAPGRDGGLDSSTDVSTVSPDGSRDSSDALDVSINTNPEVNPSLDVVKRDGVDGGPIIVVDGSRVDVSGVDGSPVVLDTAIDIAVLDVAALDVAAVDTTLLDSSVDHNLD